MQNIDTSYLIKEHKDNILAEFLDESKKFHCV